MKKILGIALLMIGVAAFAMGTPPAVPEIDGNSAGSVIALIAGALLVVRSRRK